MSRVLRWLPRAALALLALNVLVSLWPAGSQVEFAGIRFPAHGAAKPLLLLNGALLLYLLLFRRTAGGEGVPRPGRWGKLQLAWFPWVLLGAVLAVYLPSLGVNFQHPDWTHRHVGAALGSLASLGRLFTAPQVDGMYRPLAFLSFWADYRVFGPALWGYHLQSVALHFLNAFLVGRLASRLGFDRAASRTAAFLFGLGAVYCEAVVWPAARFDLLSTAFSLLGILFLLRFWRGAGGYGIAVLASFVAGVLCKETAYSLVLLIPALIATHRIWDLPPEGKRKALWLAAALALCAVVLLGVRFSLYGGIGGYRGGGAIGAKAIYSLVVNALALSVFGINSTVPTLAATLIVALFVCAVLTLAFHYAGRAGGRLWALAGFALLAAVPVVSVIGWIRPSLQHARHLYWPSVWMALLLALALGRCSRRSAVTALFVLAQVAGLTYNIWVYRDLFNKAILGANQVSSELLAANAPTAEVQLIGVPNDPHGVPYVETEIQQRIRQALPAAAVQVCPDPAACAGSLEGRPVFAYAWDAGRRTIRRLGR
jgi:hypothetical protein